MKNILRFFAAGEDKPLITDSGEIDRKYRRLRLSVMLGITLGYGFLYTCRLALSVVKKPLIDAGIFSPDELGIIGSAFFYAYAFGRLTNGFLADHANIKRFFPFGVLISALINLTMAGTSFIWIWIILWGLNGWFQGFGSPSSVVAMSHWFSNRERGRYYGIWSTAHSIGEGLTFVGTAVLVSMLGWRAGFIGPGFFCIATAAGLYLALQDRPRTLGLPSIADWKNDHGAAVEVDSGKKATLKMQLLILKMPSMWILGIACATMSATRYAINSWGILFLQESRGFTLVQAGGILGLNTIAGLAGCAAYGFISDKLFNARRPPVTLLYGLLEVLSLSYILFVPSENVTLLTLAFVLYGFSLSGILAALGGLFAIDIASKKASGAAMGFIGVFSYLGAAIQERISGYLIEQGTMIIEGVRSYNFDHVVLFWIGTSVVSLLVASTLWRVRIAE
ncbi:MFS transporter [candidate division KSB1 bacterium]|nr:MFS transporter [candidate division KSB1 bacterium]